MNKSEYGVHQTHCCITHGCKYGDRDCPVVSEEITQLSVCEYCYDNGIKDMYTFHAVRRKQQPVCPHCNHVL